MNNNNLIKAMIKTAVTKGINDIQTSPRRGMRNLVDLGERFSLGHFQKEFFQIAQNELNNEGSSYYKIVEKIINNTDEDILVTFGMNLGFNSLVVGAHKIRTNKKKYNYHIPWTIFFQIAANNNHTANIDIALDLISQGKELGIYSYIFFFDLYETETNDMELLLNALADEDQCAFFVFAKSSLFSNSAIEKISKMKTVFPLVKIPDSDKQLDAKIMLTINQFKQYRCLYGCYVDDKTYTHLEEYQKTLAILEEVDTPFSVFVDNQKQKNSIEPKEIIRNLRQQLSIQTIPIDLFSDIMLIDKNISGDPYISILTEDREFKVYDEINKELHITHYDAGFSLSQALHGI